MNRSTGIFVAMLAAAGLAVAVFFMLDPPGVYVSPQEVYAASIRAAKKGDVRAWCGCLTDDSRDIFAADRVFFASGQMLIERFEKKGGDAGALEKVFAKHGLTDDFLIKLQNVAQHWVGDKVPAAQKLEIARGMLEKVDDRNGLIVDLFKASGGNPLEMWEGRTLSDVKINGNQAVGVLTASFEGKEITMPIHFRVQGEGWRIDLFAAERRPALPPGHP